MSMSEDPSPKATTYNSPSIQERRRRILRETRIMIAERGVQAFNVRDLCARAGIAQRTLYNAFGGRENVIALAINEYYLKFASTIEPDHPHTTLRGRVERMALIHHRNLQIKPYTTAIMSVYWSNTVARPIRNVIRDMAFETNAVLIDELERRGELQPGLSSARLVEMLTIQGYGTLTDWCLEEFEDEQLVPRMIEGLLIILSGATEGEARREAGYWLDQLRSGGPDWLEVLAYATSGGEGRPRTVSTGAVSV